ncbi:STAS domain-containing protein [Desulfoluna spongiiphila]|uniref:Anti-anti-sigma factor n=1 Tax=Desulfoluna spongiiphila TaxID=419481 RepID=A0A1G5F592_9BACT|nr:STAS domain-containing protein [Desulfoluna spongiiphila]SCY34446.1 anti-anti-sigma factor [Desulfoluna spongiiphila]
MQYEVEHNDTVAIVTLTGSVTIEHAAELKELLNRVLTEATEVVVNMGNITHLDLAGIQLFCAACRSAEGGGTRLLPKLTGSEVIPAALMEAGFNRRDTCAEQRCETCFWKGDVS